MNRFQTRPHHAPSPRHRGIVLVAAAALALLASRPASGASATANGSRICDANRVALAAIDASYTLVNNNDPIIFAAGVNDNGCELRSGEGGHSLQFRQLPAGTWTDLPVSSSSGPQLPGGTVLFDSSTVSSRQRRANSGGDGSYIVAGREFATSTNLDYANKVRDDHTEGQWALDFSNCPSGTTYEFRVRWGSKKCGDQSIVYPAQVTTAGPGVGGAGRSFTYLGSPVDVTPGVVGAWVDVDVSSWVPAGATGVILQEVNSTGTSFPFGVRKNGSVDTWMASNNTSKTRSLGFHMIGVDAGGIFEAYTGSTSVKTYLLGYTTAGVTFFTNALNMSVNSTGSWQDIDISAHTGSDTAIGAVFVVRNTGGDANVALRMKGSSDDRYSEFDSEEAQTVLMGVDGNEVAQMKIASTTLDLYLIGYVTSGAVFFRNGLDKSTSTTGSYVDVDITSDIGTDDANGAILALHNTSTTNEGFTVRSNGATYDHYERVVEKVWPVTGIDASNIFEQKIGNPTRDLYLTGYTLATGASLALANHDAGQEPDAFTESGAESQAELFAFNLDPGGGTVTITELVFSLSNIVGLTGTDWSFVEIYVDANDDGTIDADETTTVGGGGSVDIAGGTITFSSSFDVTSATNYILRSDFPSLSNEDTVTIDLDPAYITASATANGAASPVVHAEGAVATGFSWFTTAVDISLATTGSWQDIDLSPYLPVATTGAVVELVNTGLSSTISGVIRGTQDARNYMSSVLYEEFEAETHRWQIVKVDDNRLIEGYIESTDIDFKLVGYTYGPDPAYFDSPPDITPSSTATWTPVDLSGWVDPDARGVILLIDSISSNDRDYGIREVGSSFSTVTRELEEYGNTMYLVGLDGSYRFDAYIQDASVRIYLVGQTKSSVVYHVDDVPVADPIAGVWQELDADDLSVPTHAGGLLLYAVNNNSGSDRMFAVRPGSSGDDWSKDIGNHNHLQAFVALRGDNVWDEYIESGAADVFIAGFTRPPPARIISWQKTAPD